MQLRPSPSSVALHPLHFSRISVAFSSRTSHRNEYTATLPSPKCSASLPYYIAPLNCLLLSLHKLLRLLSDFPPSQAGSEWMGIFVWASSALSGNDIRQMGLLKVNEPQVFDAWLLSILSLPWGRHESLATMLEPRHESNSTLRVILVINVYRNRGLYLSSAAEEGNSSMIMSADKVFAFLSLFGPNTVVEDLSKTRHS